MDWWDMPRMPSQVVQTYGAGSEYDDWLQDFTGRKNSAIAAHQSELAAIEAQRKANRDAAYEALRQSANQTLAKGAGQTTAALNPGPGIGGSGNYSGIINPPTIDGATITRKTYDAPSNVVGPSPTQTSSSSYDVNAALNALWGGGSAGALGKLVDPNAVKAFEAARDRDSSYNLPTLDLSAFDAEYTDKSKDALAYADAFQRNQSAYDEQLGGGFTGGIMNSGYAVPFSNQIGGLGGLGGIPQDPSMPGVAMPWAQPWGTPGFGQPGQGNSNGVGGYGPTTQANGQQQGQGQGGGWGGPFGARNPWSLG